MNTPLAANDNEAREPPTDVSGDGPWLGFSVEQIKREFRDFHRSSPFLERFPGVAHRVRPPIERSIEFVCDFQVRVQERGGQKAACSTCLHTDKFFRDGTLIVDERGWLYIVGPECARTYYADGSFNRAELKHRDREAIRQAETFLWAKLECVPAWVDAAESLRPAMREALSAHAQLHASCPKFLATLGQHLLDRELVVFEKQAVTNARGKQTLKDVARSVATLRGRIVLSHQTNTADTLEAALMKLLPLARPTEEERIELLIQAENYGQLVAAQRLLRLGIEGVRRARDELAQHRLFYSPANFEALRRWNADPAGPRRFTIVAKERRRTIYGDGDRMLSLELPHLLNTLPALPS